MSPKASWQARLAAFVVRHAVRPRLADMSDIARVRRAFGTPVPRPFGARYTPATVAGVPGEWVEAAAGHGLARSTAGVPPPTLLYLHGGGFVGCSPRTHRSITASFALRGFRVFVPDYRLAPEHPFPAAPDDVWAVYRALRAAQPGGRFVVAGDSAGGNLSFGLLVRARDAGAVLPDAAALFSPALDMSGSEATRLPTEAVRYNADRDAMFDGRQLDRLRDAYLQGADPGHPYASPLLADLRGLPPVLVHCGADECLRDDALRLAHQLRAAGGRVELQVFETVPHVWQMSPWVPEAAASLDAAAAFLRGESPNARATAPSADAPETLDVAIVGAGIAGISAAVHLQHLSPRERFGLFEARTATGGTWDQFRYPGARSDSDMYTLGFSFQPWTEPNAIASREQIAAYLEEAVRRHGLAGALRTEHRLLSADWRSDRQHWVLEFATGAAARWPRDAADEPPASAATAAAPATAAPPPQPQPTRTVHARFLVLASGYYRYDRGHRPHWPGEERFHGRFVHPQFWPEALDVRGRRIVVIGSGATAVTLVPALAARGAAQVVMLQRSPTDIVARAARDPLERVLSSLLPANWVYRLMRGKYMLQGTLEFAFARRFPNIARETMLADVAKALPGADLARDFTPRYPPWHQRICLVPDGDLFRALRDGRAEIVTDTIERFVEHGIVLQSGRTLEADLVVTATGLEMQLMGGTRVSIDGVPQHTREQLVYKGVMVAGVPNFATVFGYLNASWTLKADLAARYLCRVLNRQRALGQPVVVPQASAHEPRAPLIDFSSGYFQRAAAQLPAQGLRTPWRYHQNVWRDAWSLGWAPLEDGHLRFQAAPAQGHPAPAGAHAAATPTHP